MFETTVRPLSAPAQRLYRLFIQPTLRPRLPAQWRSPQTSTMPIRSINRSAGASQNAAPPRTPFNDPNRPLDEKIESRMVHFVSDDEGMQENAEMLSYLVGQLNRSEEHLQQVGKHSETGLPIVRLRTKKSLRENEQVKAAQERAQNKKLVAGKELELTWGIDRLNDLEHRLKRVEGWLGEGKTVEVLIGQKRRGRKPTAGEGEELIATLRRRALDVPGVHEAAPMTGSIGGQVVLKFAGRADPKDGGLNLKTALQQERQGKMKKKEEEKARKKAEAEEKRKRGEAREKERMESLKQRTAANG